MKILIIRTYPNKININSYNVQEIGLAKALNQKGHICDVVLYNSRESDCEERFSFDAEGQQIEFMIYWLKGFGILKNGFMPSVYRLIPNYDVIQVHEYDQILSWLLYRKQVRPTVIYHGPYYDSFNRRYNLKCKVFDRFFLKRGKPECCTVVAKSSLAETFLKEKGFSNVTTVGVGLDAGNFGLTDVAAIMARREQEETVEINLLYVGKIEERRNLSFLIAVYRKLLEKYANLRFTIVGSGDKEYVEKFLTSIADLRDERKVVCIEKVTQKELVTIYAAADIFLFSSHYEIFGMVIAEAMYFGLPVVSTINGGASVLIENGISGWVLSEEEEAWTAKLGILIHDKKLCRSMGQNAANRIKEKFLWIRLADKFIVAYQFAIKADNRLVKDSLRNQSVKGKGAKD